MSTAIAGRRRLCQAAAMLLLLARAAVAGERGGQAKHNADYVEERTPEGVVVREPCKALRPPTGPESRCGALAKRAADVIARLSPLLGHYPNRKLEVSMVAFHDYPGPSIAIHSPGKVGFELGHFLSAGGDEFAPDVIPREIARAWVPDAQWDSRNAWLTEGLPQYLAWRYLLEVNPEAARILVAAAMHDAGTKVPLLRLADIQGWWARGEKVLARENREREKREARKRGLLVLRTLETVIDRERVDRALPLVMQRSGGKAPSTELFEKVCEEIAGRDLKWFFDYFVADGGIPTIELRRLPSETPGVAAGEIVVKGLPPEGSVRVEMTVRTAQGVVEHSVATRGAVTPFSVNVPAPALGITLDPDQRILRWTEAAERWKTQSAILDELPNPITRKNVPAAIDLYRRALAADPDDASLRAQALHERLGELEWAHDEWDAALADLDAAINGHSLGTYETYLCRGKAYLYHGVVQLHERRPKEALQDALAGMKSPRAVLAQLLPETPIESQRHQTLEHLLDTLINAATHY